MRSIWSALTQAAHRSADGGRNKVILFRSGDSMAQATASASDQTSRGAGGLATQTVTLSAATAN